MSAVLPTFAKVDLGQIETKEQLIREAAQQKVQKRPQVEIEEQLLVQQKLQER